jgi:hypothetical protein
MFHIVHFWGTFKIHSLSDSGSVSVTGCKERQENYIQLGSLEGAEYTSPFLLMIETDPVQKYCVFCIYPRRIYA